MERDFGFAVFVFHELQAHHHHPGDPEEDDVKAGHENVGFVIAREFRRLLRPAQCRERPKGGGEPCVEDVRVAPKVRLSCVVRIIGIVGGLCIIGDVRTIERIPFGLVVLSGHLRCLLEILGTKRHRVVVVVVEVTFRPRQPSIVRFIVPSDARPIPNRDLMAPPELAGDAPRFDVVEPVEVGLFPVLRNELGLTRTHGFERGFRQRLRINKPLVG